MLGFQQRVPDISGIYGWKGGLGWGFVQQGGEEQSGMNGAPLSGRVRVHAPQGSIRDAWAAAFIHSKQPVLTAPGSAAGWELPDHPLAVGSA